MYSVSVVLFSKTLSCLILRVRSRQIIVLVSVLPEFAEQSRFLCRVSVDFGSRLLNMVPLSKSFHNVVWEPTAKGLYFQKLLDDKYSRWPPLHINDDNSLPIHPRKVMFVSIPRF